MRPIVRLMTNRAATTFRKAENMVVDGPYTETKERLLGFYVVEVVPDIARPFVGQPGRCL